MYEEKIKKIKENLKLPVFKKIMMDCAKKLNLLEGEKIVIKSEEDFRKFKETLKKELSKIVGRAAEGLVEG